MNDALDNATRPYAAILFGATLITALYVGIKVRMRLEWTSIVLSLAYLASFFLRTPIFSSGTIERWLFYAVASLLIWGMMYMFVFQMLNLRVTLESEGAEEMASKKKSLRARIIMIAICFSVFIVTNLLVVIFKSYGWLPITSEVVNIVRCLSKLAIDIYMFPAFYTTFNFFVALKRDHEHCDFDQGTKFIISLVKVIWVLNIINAAISSLVLSV